MFTVTWSAVWWLHSFVLEFPQMLSVLGFSWDVWLYLIGQRGNTERGFEIERQNLALCTLTLICAWCMQQSNTILSSASSLFTFLVSMAVLREKFTWLKLCSVLLCMLGTIVVSLADSEQDKGSVSHAVWGDMLCLLSALFYAIYTTLLRKCLPDEDSTQGKASTALFFGYLGLFNALLLAPVGFLYFSFVETFHRPSLTQFGLVMCKGLLTPTELLSSL